MSSFVLKENEEYCSSFVIGGGIQIQTGTAAFKEQNAIITSFPYEVEAKPKLHLMWPFGYEVG